jgi:serine/threonine-protein kinase HipA
VTTLVVSVSGVRAGLLEQSREGSFFELDEEYLALPNRPILGQIFEDSPNQPHRTRQGLPPWFANLLPEGPLRDLIAERAGVHPSRSLFLLDLLGDDLPGAVTIQSADVDSAEEQAQAVAIDSEELPLRFSLAGVQLKFSATRADRGLTIPAQGLGGDWIVKLPDQRFRGVPENEYLMMQFAGRAGLDVPPTELVATNEIAGLPAPLAAQDDKALAVRRFDRTANGRVHIEDFAQILNIPPKDKYGATNYDTMARIIAAVCDRDDIDEFLRRLVFMIAIGNSDAHAKNWSLIYPDGRSARIAPAYDLVAVSQYERIERLLKPQLALNLAGIKDARAITEKTFQRFAQRTDLDEERTIAVVRDQAQEIHAAWEEVKQAQESPLDPALKQLLDERLRTLPLFR